jgi:hypothetical protein
MTRVSPHYDNNCLKSSLYIPYMIADMNVIRPALGAWSSGIVSAGHRGDWVACCEIVCFTYLFVPMLCTYVHK